MNESKSRGGSRWTPALVTGAVILALSTGGASAQTAAQNAERELVEKLAYAEALSQTMWSTGAEEPQVPQDIRIMQRIVSTALGEVEPPELPDSLRQDSETPGSGTAYVYSGGSGGSGGRSNTVTYWAGPGSRAFGIGGRDVTGFYMQGYGYLFTVRWRVGPRGVAGLFEDASMARVVELNQLVAEARRAAERGEASEARAASEAEKTLQEQRDQAAERQEAWDQWSASYRDMLADGLRNVVALYGSTLKRATPDESITFIADFGGGENETVTVSARRGALTGTGLADNLAAVEMAKGETEISEVLRTELKIMAEIIDGSLESEQTGDTWVYSVEGVNFLGRDSSYQYVPGYGVLFRKAARLNLATNVVRQVAPSRLQPGITVQSLRDRIDESTEEQRQRYAEHLAGLKQMTAAIMATYGPTLTEMDGNDWVGVYYDVGSAAGLLEGGISNFLVQARMADIRQAGNQADGAVWLVDHLVTNEAQQ